MERQVNESADYPAPATAMPVTVWRPEARWSRGSASGWRRSAGLRISPAAGRLTCPTAPSPGCERAHFRCWTPRTTPGIRYFDAARSYGLAEEFLGGWLADRGHPDAVAGSKWGYRYTGGWRMDADQQEVKEHSLAMFTAQLGQTRAQLGDRLALYQVHSLTAESGLLDDRRAAGRAGRGCGPKA